MKRYWLDASSLIWCDRDLFQLATMPKYWEWLAAKLTDGSIVTHKKIYAEVIKGADGEKPSPLALWVKSRKGEWCSYGCTDESKDLMGKISEYCINKYGFETAKKFLSGGDAHLISRASIDGGIVVTQESVLHDPRIPSVCDHFKIKHLPMNRMNIELKMKF
jgi:hypothetical protein